MILPHPDDAIHKIWLYRILTALADNIFLISALRFKGGTCAAMRGLIERFSVDLDFDLILPNEIQKVNLELEKVFNDLGLKIKDHSQKVPQFFLTYSDTKSKRNTLRFDVTFPAPNANEYEPIQFNEIDRIIHCQTVETMFANKLVALIERYEKHGSIAGRDIFDIHTFFIKGYKYKKEIIEERRKGQSLKDFFQKLHDFIENKVNQTILNEDLNYLLPSDIFQKKRKFLKPETLMFLRDEMRRIE